MQWIEAAIATQAGLIGCFLLAAAAVVVAGIRLSFYGDALGERTGLGAGFAGLVFLAGVTSLPELAVSVSAALRASRVAAGLFMPEEKLKALQQGADLAVGNMIGSNAFNLLILAGIFLFFCKKENPRFLQKDHLRPARQGLILTLSLGVLLMVPAFDWRIPLLDAGLFSLVIAAVSLYSLRVSGILPEQAAEEIKALPQEQALAGRPALRFYPALVGLTGMIVAAGTVLSLLAGRMALPPEQGGFGLQESLIGSLFLAVCTSLPELVVCVSCARAGFPDLAVGNVLGSNLFNMLLIFGSDVALRGGAILRCAGPEHLVMLAAVAVMSALSIRLLRRQRLASRTEPSAGLLLIFAVYLIAATLSFLL